MMTPEPRPINRRGPNLLHVRPDPKLESEKAERDLIPDYDPARSAAEFLAKYLKLEPA